MKSVVEGAAVGMVEVMAEGIVMVEETEIGMENDRKEGALGVEGLGIGLGGLVLDRSHGILMWWIEVGWASDICWVVYMSVRVSWELGW